MGASEALLRRLLGLRLWQCQLSCLRPQSCKCRKVSTRGVCSVLRGDWGEWEEERLGWP